jgi:hypothetical protein
MSTATIDKTLIQGFIDHLEHCLCADLATPSNDDDENFYALLASNIGTGIPATELKKAFQDATVRLLEEAKLIFNDFLESEENHIGYLISICSLVLDFSIAYEAISPPSFKNRCFDDLETIRAYLVSIKAFENYPSFIRGVDAPTFIYQRYNPKVDFAS